MVGQEVLEGKCSKNEILTGWSNEREGNTRSKTGACNESSAAEKAHCKTGKKKKTI